MKSSWFKSTLRSVIKYLADCATWMGYAGPLCWIDPRFMDGFMDEGWMPSAEAGDQPIQRSPDDSAVQSFHWRKSA